MFDAFVLRSDTSGLFVGHRMGLAFFSKDEDAGQTVVVTFDTEVEARDFATTYLASLTLNVVPIQTTTRGYATIEELVAAGLQDDIGLLLRNVPTSSTIQ